MFLSTLDNFVLSFGLIYLIFMRPEVRMACALPRSLQVTKTPWNGKGFRLEADQDLGFFFFQTGNIPFQNIVGLSFLCFCFVGLVATS